MSRILCLYLCAYVNLVTVSSQNHQTAYPYSRLNNGNIYGSAPLILHQPHSYTPHYIIQNVPNYQTKNSITDLQQTYFNKLLTNPAIQAFIDPSTKIYNQNGVEISDQILPRTPNVVNNYFIVSNDYLNDNAKGKMQANEKHKANMISLSKSRKIDKKLTEIADCNPKSNLEGEMSKHKEQRSHASTRQSKKRKKNSSPNNERSEISKNDQKSENKKNSILNNVDLIFDDEIQFDKAKTNIKRQDTTKATSIKTVYETATNSGQRVKPIEVTNEKDREIPKENIGKSTVLLELNKSKSTATLNKEIDVKKQSNHLDNRNNSNRNPVEKSQNKPSLKNQDNFMKEWMEYIKSFTPIQNFDSFDFTHLNLPNNFEQMYRFPKASRTGSDTSAAPKNQRRKQQKKNKQQTENNSNRNTKKGDITTKIEVESKPILTEIIKENIESVYPTPVTKSLEATHYLIDISTENSLPIVYDIIDYYPDFTQDKLYTSNENDHDSFFNRHFYETKGEDVIDQGSKYAGKRDSTKHIEKSKRGNTIPSSNTDFKDHRKPVFEDLKFQTPPTLIDPGFETKKVNSRDINHIESKANDDNFNQAKRKNVETVFARSKVVKYGQHDEVLEKPKVIEEYSKNDVERKHNSKNGDTTVVFAQAWK